MELISKLEPLAEKQEVYKARLANLELPGKYTDTEEKITFYDKACSIIGTT